MNYVEARNAEELCDIFGLPRSYAPRLRFRRDLVIAIRKTVRKKKWTHAQAAKKADVGRTVITAVMNGNLQGVSTDRLMDIAQNLGLKLKLEVA
jgi:predicted XRE-type DNA-binding protein